MESPYPEDGVFARSCRCTTAPAFEKGWRHARSGKLSVPPVRSTHRAAGTSEKKTSAEEAGLQPQQSVPRTAPESVGGGRAGGLQVSGENRPPRVQLRHVLPVLRGTVAPATLPQRADVQEQRQGRAGRGLRLPPQRAV